MSTRIKLILTGSILIGGILFALYVSRIHIYEPIKISVLKDNNKKSGSLCVSAGTVFGNTIAIKPDHNNEYRIDKGYFNNISISDTGIMTEISDTNFRVLVIQNSTGKSIGFSYQIKNDQYLITEVGSRSYFKILESVFKGNIVIFTLLILAFLTIGIYFFLKKRKIITPYQALIIYKSRYGIFALIFLVGVFLRFSTPLITILDPDSTGYSAPALKCMISGGFDHVGSRSYPYPVFGLIILSVFRDINFICIVQHLLGLLSVVGLLIFIEQTIKEYLKSSRQKIIYTIFTSIYIFTLLLNGNIILFEKMLRPEGLIMPCSIIILILIFKYFRYKKTEKRWFFYAITLFALSFFSILHPRMSAALTIISIIILVWEIKSAKKKSFSKIVTPLIIFLIVFAISLIPEEFLIKKYDVKSPAFAYRQFLYTNANSALKAINEGYAVDYEFDNQVLKKDILIALKKNPKKDKFRISQYNVDYLQYDLADKDLVSYLNISAKQSIIHTNNKLLKPVNQISSEDSAFISKELKCRINERYVDYYKSWFMLLIKKYPLEILNKTGRQLFFVFFHPYTDFLRFGGVYSFEQSFQKKYIRSYNYLVSSLNYKPEEKITVVFPGIISQFISTLSFFLRFAFIVSVLYFFAMFVKKRLSVFIFSITFIVLISIVTVAFFHTFDFDRYITSLSPLMLSLIYLCSLDILLKKPKQQMKPVKQNAQ